LVDIATLIGLLGGFGIILGAIASGRDIILFVNVPSILIVVGGTFMVTLMQVSLGDFLGSFSIGMKAFGVGLCVDGHDPTLVNKLLSKDIDLTIQRHEVGQTMFKNMATMAPAMGMIGTLVGLVQMLANMSDPASIGPAMAVALLTTLYGAVIANVFAQPMAEKLARASAMEKTNKSLIIETIAGIQEGMNPRVLEQLLSTYLPAGKRPTNDS
jgi:chemotaxis protein MotA